MTEENLTVVLSDWYELVKGDELMQGDIFEDCPVFLPPRDLQWPLDLEKADYEFEVGQQDVIVMSQSCDLVADQKADIWLVLLCPIWKLSEVARVNSFLASSYGKEQCRRGNMPGYHMLEECQEEQWKRDISIVSFRETYSLPLNFVRNMARAIGQRPRIRSPYREHLAQSFARYFMRVGLPVNITPFKSNKAEAEVIKRLDAMDDETRQRILDSFN